MTPEEAIAAVEPAKRADVEAIHALIRKTLPKLATGVSGRFVGYGPYHYRYDSGREGDGFRVCWTTNKTGISIYVTAVDEAGWVAEQFADRLGKASVGKSCIRFKKLVDIDQKVLVEVLRRVKDTEAPGAVSSSPKKK